MYDITFVAKVLLVLLGIAGFFLSRYLHKKKQTQEQFVCFLKADCHTVINSRYSKFLGIELPFLGMGYYAFVFIVYGISLSVGVTPPEWLNAIILGLTVGATAFSAYLTALQGLVIKEWCSWCLVSAAMSTTIFLISVFGLNTDVVGALATISGAMQTLYNLAFGVGLGAATVSTAFFFKFIKDKRISEWEAGVLNIISQVSWFSIGLLVLSGIAFYIPNASILNSSPLFFANSLIIIAILINSLLLHIYVEPRLVHISLGKSYPHYEGELNQFPRATFALGGISVASWYSAFIFNSTESLVISFGTAISIYILATLCAVGISQFMKRQFSRNN